jgi:formyltetrahydrofolate-dependent phosphoribosylglycinamide formyltransferase
VTARIAVLASGTGSNLEAILNHFADGAAAETGAVVLVASDNPRAGALARARARGIPATTLPNWADGPAIVDRLRDARIDTIALAGYLRFLPPEITRGYRGRVLNVHPALLPAFGGRGMYGHRVHDAVIAAGARVSGATVHFVDEEYDHGPIIAQEPVPVFPDDDAATLAQRVLRTEHAIYPRSIEAVVAGRVVLCENGRVRGSI